MDVSELSLMQRLAPELTEKICQRARVLEMIFLMQPIGRRVLAQKLGMPEREARTACDALREDGLVISEAAGMRLTEAGVSLAPSVREMIRSFTGVALMERQLAERLNAGRVIVVPGDADQDPDVLREVGRAAAQRLCRILEDGMTLAVSGGSTVAAVAAAMPGSMHADVYVLPARGGMGGTVETQAGTIAAEFAHALGGRHSLLHLPDAVTPDALRELKKLPEISQPLTALDRADVLLSGIARADVMAKNRHLPPEDVMRVMDGGAVAEAVGSYFDVNGELVFQASGLGLTGKQLAHIPVVIAVAAGARKAEAIVAVARHHRNDLIVTDEGAARAIANLAQNLNFGWRM